MTTEYRYGGAVTPHNTTPLACGVCRALHVNSSDGNPCDVTLITVGGDTITFADQPSGTYLYVAATHVKSTGTGGTAQVTWLV